MNRLGPFDYINNAYGLAVRRGSRVEYTGGDKQRTPRQGAVASAAGAHLNIRFDDDPHRVVGPFHPTWELRYLDDDPATGADPAESIIDRTLRHARTS